MRKLGTALIFVVAGAIAACVPATATANTTPARMAPSAAAATAPGMNVIEIMVDDMRYDDLAYMPNLQAQINRGVKFENSFSSFPLCCPARSVFLSGIMNHNNGVYGISDDPNDHGGYTYFNDKKSLGTSLRAAGYNTGFIGKYLNGYGYDYKQRWIRHQYPPGDLNYDRNVDNDVPPGWTIWQGSLDADSDRHPEHDETLWGVGTHPGSTYNYLNMTTSTNSGDYETHKGTYSTYLVSRLTTQQITKFDNMRTRQRKPFFMSVNYVAPHFGAPHRADDQVNGKQFATAYVPPETDGPFLNFLNSSGLTIERGPGINKPDTVNQVGSLTEPTLEDHPFPTAQFGETQAEVIMKNGYRRAQSVWLVDKQIPKIVNALKARGEWRRTVIFFTSDNGYFLGENGRTAGKIYTMEPSLRVPLAAFGGGLPKMGTTVYAPATTADLSATIMKMTGAKAPWGYLDGRSLWPAMSSDTGSGWQRVARFESRYPELMGDVPQPRLNHFGIRTSQYYYGESEGIVEMYDLKADPMEWTNLVSADGTVAPGYEGVAAALKSLLDQTSDCKGAAACQPLLPDSLKASPLEARTTYVDWYQAVHSMVGNF